MTSSEGLTLDEVADMVCDLLTARNFEVLRTETLPLTIGGELIAWSYPSIVVCRRQDVKSVVVCRFGPTASLPGYLLKYLDAARRGTPEVPLYLACRDALAASYTRLCSLYGLGLVTYSLENHRMTFVQEPTALDIATAFDQMVGEALKRAREASAARSEDVGRRAAKFRTHAKNTGLSDRHEAFEAELGRISQRMIELESRAQEVRASKNLADLEDLKKMIDDEVLT